MTLNNTPKAVGIVLCMILLTLVFALDKLSEAGYIGLMGLIVGYLVGNGIAAKAGEPVEPVLGRADDTPPA